MILLPAAKTRIRGILFDKDGTLFDFHETWRPVMIKAAFQAAGGDRELSGALLRAGGYDHEAGRFAADSVIASGHAGELAELWGRLGAIIPSDDLRRHLDMLFSVEGLVSAVPVADLQPLFQQLRGHGLALGIATNDSVASARAMVLRYGLGHLVDFVAGYDSGYGPKPGPGMALAFCESVRLDPSRVAVVGDSEHDMAMGRSAELGARIAVLSGAGTLETLAPSADLLLQDITGLLDLFAAPEGGYGPG